MMPKDVKSAFHAVWVHAAFAAGIETAQQMALAAAIIIEVRDDAGEVRQRAAAAALQGVASGLKDTFLTSHPAAPISETRQP